RPHPNEIEPSDRAYVGHPAPPAPEGMLRRGAARLVPWVSMENPPTVDELSLALLILRLVVGPVFAFHGFAKITRGGKLEGTARWFDSMGMKPGKVHARAAAFGELATGTCLALGLFTPLAGLGLVGLMAVAFWTVHKGSGL